ncbi:MAG: efflux RND transporter periplasmic adaptor subunit [Candidatus Pacebacteria bacterium]|nr:efflux RND transporter periplasmic adaptor subunit [Candidatus Paceibacterota bacterium]
MISLIKKPVFLIVVAVVLIGGFFLLRGSKAPDYDFVEAKLGSVIQEVSVTGTVKPSEAVTLAFEKVGKVSKINVAVGNSVSAGAILIQLENSDVAAQLAGYEATLKSEQAQLEELKKGTRPEEIQIQETKVANAKIAVEDAKKVLINRIQDAYIKCDDAVRNKADQFFSNARTANPVLNFSVNNQAVKTDVENSRKDIESILNAWKSSVDNLVITSNFETYISGAKTNLDIVKVFMDKAATALGSAVVSTNVTQTNIDAWRSDVSTGRTNVSTATISLSSAEQDWRTAGSSLTLEENELALDQAGTVAEQIAAQQAVVDKARADVDNARAQLAKTILYSPIDGIVTKVDIKKGEVVSIGANIVSIISKSKFEVEVNVPEADIAKVKIGDSAKITLDAYGNDVVFGATVTKIDPAETMIEGVATYKTTLQFTQDDEKIKSGMTANIDILSARADNVIVIPQRAVIGKNGDKTVKVLDGKNVLEKKVKIGLRGSDGNVEVVEGLNVGEKVITSL